MDEQRPLTPSRVDINAASVEQLRDEIVGIGQVLAERIVAFRAENGAFDSIDGLVKVTGIGPKLLQHIADQLTIGGSGAEAITDSGAPADETESALPTMMERIAPIELEDIATETEDMSSPPSDDTGQAGVVEDFFALPAQSEDDVDEWLDADDEPDLPVNWDEDEDELFEGEDEADLEDLTPEELDEIGNILDAGLPAAGLLDEPESEPEPEPAEAEKPVEVMEPMNAAREASPMAAVAAAPIEATPPVAAPVVTKEKKHPSSILMVLLGGLLGVVLTLLAGIAVSGTVDFAPRRQVEALSRNMGTMQSNHELAWERIDALTLQAEELDRHLKSFDGVADTVATLETDIAAAQRELTDIETNLDSLSTQLGSLETALKATDTKVTGIESQVGELEGSVSELQTSVTEVKTTIGRFDGFFSALRDLLVEMQGAPVETTP